MIGWFVGRLMFGFLLLDGIEYGLSEVDMEVFYVIVKSMVE